MGLIYVNPEGPNGNPDPRAAATGHPHDVPSHGDERRGDRRPDRRRPHARQGPRRRSREVRRPRTGRRRIEEQGLGWKNTYGTGKGADTITSGLEGAWTSTPMKWSHDYFGNLFRYEWELTKSPAGAQQWKPKGDAGAGTVPDAHDPSKTHRPMMLTTDLSLRMDPAYARSRSASTRTRTSSTPRSRGLVQAHAPRHGSARAAPRPAGSPGAAAVAGPGAAGHPRSSDGGRRRPEAQGPRFGTVRLAAGLDRVGVRGHVPRHGHARWRQRRPHPPRAAEGLGGQRAGRAGQGPAALEGIQKEFNDARNGRQEGLAGRPHRAGRVRGVEEAAKDAGHDVQVPFTPGRTDATQEMTDVESFAVLEPDADGFRNYLGQGHERAGRASARRPGAHADAERTRDDRAGRRPARAERELPDVRARRVHQAARDADQRLLRQPARHGDGVAEVGGRGHLRGPRSPDGRAPSGTAPASTSSSARTPSCAQSRRSTRATTRSRSSSRTSSPPGSRS